MSDQTRARIRTVFQEPLLHFLVLGAAVFVAFSLVSDPPAETPDAKTLVVSQETAEQLVAGFRQTWRRYPSEQELEAVLASFVREEILVREAEALSLDADDPIIRRRLSQKMEFLIESAAGAPAPEDSELKAFFEETRDSYASEPRIAFQQVFLGTSPDPEVVSSIVAQLSAGTPAAQVGQPTLLPQAMRPSVRQAVDSTFGTGFFAALSRLEPGNWAGPVESGFGQHAVRVLERREGRIPELAEVRARVETAWRAAQAEEVSAAFFAQLEAGYDVSLPSKAILQDLIE